MNCGISVSTTTDKVFASLDALEDDLVMGLLAMENTPEISQVHNQLALDY